MTEPTNHDTTGNDMTGIIINHPINPAPADVDTWTTTELQEQFDVIGFAAGMVIAKRKSDNVTGTLEFDGSPRIYHSWRKD